MSFGIDEYVVSFGRLGHEYVECFECVEYCVTVEWNDWLAWILNASVLVVVVITVEVEVVEVVVVELVVVEG